MVSKDERLNVADAHSLQDVALLIGIVLVIDALTSLLSQACPLWLVKMHC